MIVDWTLSLGSILQILAFLAAGVGVVYALRDDVKQVQGQLAEVKTDVSALTSKVETLGTVMVELTRVDGRINTIETRLNRTETDVSDLRRGEGFVLPLIRK